MTLPTSSRSAKRTTSVTKRVVTGQRATDPFSENISGSGWPAIEGSPTPPDPGTTVWYLENSAGNILAVELPGNGRISWSRSQSRGTGECRIYRDATTKVYDAVFSDVQNAWSDRVKTTNLGPSAAVRKATEEAEAKEMELRKMHAEKVAERLIGGAKTFDPDDDLLSPPTEALEFIPKSSW